MICLKSMFKNIYTWLTTEKASKQDYSASLWCLCKQTRNCLPGWIVCLPILVGAAPNFHLFTWLLELVTVSMSPFKPTVRMWYWCCGQSGSNLHMYNNNRISMWDIRKLGNQGSDIHHWVYCLCMCLLYVKFKRLNFLGKRVCSYAINLSIQISVLEMNINHWENMDTYQALVYLQSAQDKSKAFPSESGEERKKRFKTFFCNLYSPTFIVNHTKKNIL